MSKLKLWSLPVLSGVLLGISWPETGGFTALIFIALLPLLFFEDRIQSNRTSSANLKVYAGAYLTFFLFNMITTWWIKYASVPGMWMAEILNSLFMAIIFWLYSISRKHIGLIPGLMSLVIFWLAFEWVHYNWELSWVWLTFGNVFAAEHMWIQWYEFTGVLGGSLWVLLANVFFYITIIKLSKDKALSRVLIFRIAALFLILVGPIVYSVWRYNNYRESGKPSEVVIVQPNIDPYHEKFSGMSESAQIDLLFELASKKTTEATDFVVCPETAFPVGYWEHELHLVYGPEKFKELVQKYPNLRVVTGLSTMRLYGPDEVPSATARQFNDGTNNSYDYYNTAMQIDISDSLQIYHKSKLVLGVEKMPFGSLLKPLEKLAINLGGASGSLGFDETPFNFRPSGKQMDQSVVAPVICYESVYGEFLTEYIKKGAELIFIITNDGWWEDTPGYRQHLAYARLRAIENRRCIARSANTGISAFITQKGDLIKATNWWERTVISEKIYSSKEITPYVIYGDFIGRVAAFFSLLLLAMVAARSVRKKNSTILGN